MITQFIFSALDKLRRITRARTPVCIQMEAAECGSTCLMIIMAYNDKFVPAAELRYRCGVSRDGSNAFDLIKAAQYYGLNAEGYYATIEELRAEADYPSILYWENNHFVVLEGFNDNIVYINDPNFGPTEMEASEFLRHYSGVVLTLEVTESFKKGGTQAKFMRPLINKIKNFKNSIAAIFILNVLLVFLGISFAVFAQIFVDQILTPPAPTWVGTFMVCYFSIAIVYTLLLLLESRILNRLQTKISIMLSTEFFFHAMQLPLFFFHQRHLGEILRRMNLNVQVATFTAHHFTKVIINLSLLAIYLYVVYKYDEAIGFITTGIVVYNIVILVMQNEMRKHIYAKSQQVMSKYIGISIDSINNVESIRLTGSEPFLFQRVIGLSSNLSNTFQKMGKRDAWINSISAFSQLSLSIFLIGIAGWKVVHGGLTAGMYISLQLLVGNIMAPIKELMLIGMQLPLLKIDLMRIDDVMMNEIDPIIAKKVALGEKSHPTEIKGGIVVKDISFGYQPLNEPLIRKVSFEILPGELVGITGHNGSGKSTVMRLIAGQYPPQHGHVYYDGIDIQKIPLTVTNRAVVIVEQEALFFPGTIRENLTFWNPYIKEEDLFKACTDACIHDVIRQKKNGYNYILDEDARNFSKGQRQRLDIARALLYKPSVIILDEAMNGLEIDLILKIFKNIKSQVKTMIVISHHKNVLDLCDRLLVFKEGRLVDEEFAEEGT